MTFEMIDRPRCKREAAELLRTAQVPPKAMTALYFGLVILLDLIASFTGSGFLGIFAAILAALTSSVLGAGFALYCMAIRRGERAEYLTLFDGFSFVGKLIALELLTTLFVSLWSLLFVIPGIIAVYRYSFAMFNLYENPGIGVMEALEMSKRQTLGYKSQLFMLNLSYFGWNLLAHLPTAILSRMVAQTLADEILYGIPAATAFFGVPIPVLIFIADIWNLAVALFYYPNYFCVHLSYFETAKKTSGVGEGAEPPQPPAWGGWDAPDGLG